MAKELPYFKFEPESWENGNIQICSKESKGLFIDLCSIYWSRLGELPYALALQKHCNGNKDALQELIKNEVIGIKEDQIIIEFLDEQLNEFIKTSEKRRNAANKRWKNAKEMQMHSKSNAIREEKRREKKRKEEKISFSPPTFEQSKDYFFEKLQNNEYAVLEAERFIDYYSSKGWTIGKSKEKMKDYKAAIRNWLKNNFNDNGKQKSFRQSEEYKSRIANLPD